jgi:hypothetical protein
MLRKVWMLLMVIAVGFLVSCVEKEEVGEPVKPKVPHEKMIPKVEEEKKIPAVEKEEKTAYACPMKCYISTEPGKCPKCGMEMNKVEK